jgi:hypothetical protein
MGEPMPYPGPCRPTLLVWTTLLMGACATGTPSARPGGGTPPDSATGGGTDAAPRMTAIADEYFQALLERPAYFSMTRLRGRLTEKSVQAHSAGLPPAAEHLESPRSDRKLRVVIWEEARFLRLIPGLVMGVDGDPEDDIIASDRV